ncbi:MAG TPA: GNAT family N-acetyltransferase [Kofleriaceae bacterium]|nr:GNAT family N-acetyltransferase [Kofleriaceae bacterium]
MQIRSLEGAGWDVLAPAFNDAFSDYAVPMSTTPEGLEAMQRRRGYVAGASYGAFDGGRLVGFVLTCLEGDRAYNSGTGVVPAYRRTGVARRLLEAVIDSVGVASYVLEVLEDNAKAIAFYARCGFVETRRFLCWTYGRGERRAAELAELASPDLAAIAAHGDVEPSWQNSLTSLARAGMPYVALGDEHGAAVVFPGSGDLPLLAVRRDARRRGHGTRLLQAAAARSSRPLRILNIDSRAGGIAAFLDAAGAVSLGRQIEMVRTIREHRPRRAD